MKYPSHPNRRRLLGMCAFFALSATGCGGNADDNYQSADLYGAYEAIKFGMSSELVTSLVGASPVNQSVDSKGIITYRWEVDRGTRLFTTLLVQFNSEFGVVGKVITGPDGNQSEILEET